jgi:hypothetical protein
MMYRIRYYMLVSVLSVAAACAHYDAGSAGGELGSALFFTNESLDQADVYAVTMSGERIRIGTVQAGRTDTLLIPASITERGENVNVIARLVARSVVPQSGPLAIRPGDRLEMRLPPDGRTLFVVPARP